MTTSRGSGSSFRGFRVDKEYSFDTEQGTKTLAGLFDGRSQLLVYHFMYEDRS